MQRARRRARTAPVRRHHPPSLQSRRAARARPGPHHRLQAHQGWALARPRCDHPRDDAHGARRPTARARRSPPAPRPRVEPSPRRPGRAGVEPARAVDDRGRAPRRRHAHALRGVGLDSRTVVGAVARRRRDGLAAPVRGRRARAPPARHPRRRVRREPRDRRRTWRARPLREGRIRRFERRDPGSAAPPRGASPPA